MQKIDLTGIWRYEKDETNIGIDEKFYLRSLKHNGFVLPGSCCGNGIGRQQQAYDTMDKNTVRAPRERYEYIGVLWLQREIDIPESFAGKDLYLFLERVNMASGVWLDGKQTGRRIVSLSVPHRHRLARGISAGRHTITVRIDNTNLLNIDSMASGYSVDTQGYWNGIIGKIELQCEEICHIENIQIFPEKTRIRFRAVATSDIHSPSENKKAYLSVTLKEEAGEPLAAYKFPFTYHTSKQVFYDACELASELRLWSEFQPACCSFCAELFVEDGGEYRLTDEKEYLFGMRIFEVKDKQFCLNGQTISLRGTTNCAIDPTTGYPPMDFVSWQTQFRIIKSYGLNYMRFHAWCPPENAFLAADKEGVYLSVEMPLWLNLDVCALETGDDLLHEAYFEQEALAISRQYGNHPSFLLFSNGNELLGDFQMLDAITTRIRAYDNRRLYTVTSNFDHPVLPCEDYFCAFTAAGNPVRIQNMQDETAQNTALSYRKAVDELPVPIVSFEIGQYCVYPDVDGTDDYTGNMRAVNLDVIRDDMRQNGVYQYLREYVRASGDLAVKLYKEDIEAALRTKGFGGFGLLSLCDYTGQCTATVGILDAFYRSKGLISPEEFRQFCSDGVPLFLAKRIYTNDEVMEASLDFYDYRAVREPNPIFTLRIYWEDKLFYETITTDRTVSIPLSEICAASMLSVELSVADRKNCYRVFVYPKEQAIQEQPAVLSEIGPIRRLLQEGGCAVVTARRLKQPIKGSFIPVFWSPAFFETDAACGAMIQKDHPAFLEFATDEYPDYQWKTLLEHSWGADLSAFGETIHPLVEPVPNFFRNIRRSPLFEANVGKAKVLFCGFDLEREEPEVRQLRKSLYAYVASERFLPQERLGEKEFLDLFREA